MELIAIVVLLLSMQYLRTQAATVQVRWDVGYVYLNRDGRGMRRAIGVNGTLPVPPVYLSKGDRLELQVNNTLDVPTSVHAHGVFQNGTAYLDGPSMVTQCGIPPASVFTYSYEVAGQSGLFWLHGHTAHQNAAGLRAPLVVRDTDAQAPYRNQETDEDNDYQLLWFEDWYPREFNSRASLTIHQFPPPVTYPSALVNGHSGAWQMPLLRISHEKTRRIDLINMSITESFRFSIPGFKLLVIETDGYYTMPTPVDGVDLGPGQRYSVLVSPANETSACDVQTASPVYKVELYADFIPRRLGLNPRVHYGRIHYIDKRQPHASFCTANITLSVSESPDATEKKKQPMVWTNDIRIQGLANQRALAVDRQIEIDLGGAEFTDHTVRDTIDGITFTHARIPTLYSVLTLPTDAMARNTTLYGVQTHTVVLDHLQVIELKINNPNFLVHPMHLHGHRFQVVEYGPVEPSKRPTALPPTANEDDGATESQSAYYSHILSTIAPMVSNYERPTERDTVMVPPMQYVRIRFRADNPGVWLLHCHMDIHFAMGMAMTFVEAPEVLRKSVNVPPEMLNMCKTLGVGTRGNAVGNMDFNLDGLPPLPTIVPAAA
ncbi:ferroxidase fet3 [Coemansia sp. RSA 1200]|nr:ferroxidase fet3 [Coemansia sp. RSA 1200]